MHSSCDQLVCDSDLRPATFRPSGLDIASGLPTIHDDTVKAKRGQRGFPLAVRLYSLASADAAVAINSFANSLQAGCIGMPKNCSLKARKNDEDIINLAA